MKTGLSGSKATSLSDKTLLQWLFKNRMSILFYLGVQCILYLTSLVIIAIWMVFRVTCCCGLLTAH